MKSKIDYPCRIGLQKGGSNVKKIDPRRGVWDWIFGGGWANGGASG